MSVPTTLKKTTALRAPRKVSARAGSSPASARFPQRRAFLGLPLAQRRAILKAQALVACGYYAQATDWREWEGADLTRQTDE